MGRRHGQHFLIQRDSQLTPLWLSKTKRPGNYDCNSLFIDIQYGQHNYIVYIYIHAAYVYITISLYHDFSIHLVAVETNACSIFLQEYHLTKTRKNETQWHCLKSFGEFTIVDVQKSSFALRLIVKCFSRFLSDFPCDDPRSHSPNRRVLTSNIWQPPLRFLFHHIPSHQ